MILLYFLGDSFMTIFKKIAIHAIILPFFMANLTTNAMQMVPCPTIQTKVYFHPTKAAFYATDENIKYLNKKGIATPTNPILREVLKAEVTEADGTITDWKQNPTKAIKNYEEAQIKQQNLSFNQALPKNLALQNKTFPRFLPLESSFNCTNGSKINRTIEDFPTQITFESTNNFSKEQDQCSLQFFKNPDVASCQHDLHKHVDAGLLTKKITPVNLIFTNPFTGQEDIVVAEKIKYSHGKNGIQNNTKCIIRMIEEQTFAHPNVHNGLFKRQIDGK